MFEMSGNTKWGVWAVAFVWFTTHFGGGFASGRQLVDFYVQYGWYAVFTPIVSAGLITTVLYCAWSFSVKHKVYDYRSWSVAYYEPLGRLEPFFSLCIEVMYLIILLMATGVAFSTGAETLKQLVPGLPYNVTTVGIALLIFALTIWGAETVRKAATFMAILIISGMLLIYVSNLVTNFPALISVVESLPSANGGFWPAMWQSVKYAGLQCSLIGAYTAVADSLSTQKDVKKATLIGFTINAGVLVLAATGALSHYPAILDKSAIPLPITYITQNGGGGSAGMFIFSLVMLLAVVSTGVGLIYGGARRISTWWMKRAGAENSRKIDVISSAVYVAASWYIASFGLIRLIAQGYAWVGVLSTPLVVIPVLLTALIRGQRAALPMPSPSPAPSEGKSI
jgi:uncharacterized membrane protein YkvI